jgi:hypothetical protein
MMMAGLLLLQFENPAGTDATCADSHFPSVSAYHDVNGLKVGHPDASRLVVRVAHVIAELQSFSADITSSGHSVSTP